jgi:hypothetical protein
MERHRYPRHRLITDESGVVCIDLEILAVRSIRDSIFPMNTLPSWKLEKHYHPTVVALDNLATADHTRHIAQQRTCELATNIETPYSMENFHNTQRSILDFRNLFAQACGIPYREKPSSDRGYDLDAGTEEVWQTPRVSVEDLRANNHPVAPNERVQSRNNLTGDLSVLVVLDGVISKIDRLIWEQEYPRHGSNVVVDTVVRNPCFQDPDALRRNGLLIIRNGIANDYGIPIRNLHDLSSNWRVSHQNGRIFDLPGDIYPGSLRVRNG